jgi:hypothetical protein
MNLSKYLSVIIVYVMFGCNEVKIKTSTNIKIERDEADLVVVGEKNFQLDSLSSPFINALSVFSHEGRDYFSFLNKEQNRIYVYDMEFEDIKYYTPFDREGPNGVGSVEGYHIFNPDSILFLDSWTNKVSLTDKAGSLVEKFTMSGNMVSISPLLPVPRLGTTNPVHQYKGKFYFTGYSIGEFKLETNSNRPVILSYDKSIKKVTYDLSYPDIYQDVSWGATSYRAIYSDINPQTNHLIISFPADHNLWFYNVENGNSFSKYAGSQYFGDITSFHENKMFMERKPLEEFFGKNPSYSSVIYDKYREVYYRIADHPIQDYDESSRKTSVKKFSIIILNKDMEKIGETAIPHLSHSRLSYFISEEGFNLQKYQNNEDLLVYTTFKLRYK